MNGWLSLGTFRVYTLAWSRAQPYPSIPRVYHGTGIFNQRPAIGSLSRHDSMQVEYPNSPKEGIDLGNRNRFRMCNLIKSLIDPPEPSLPILILVPVPINHFGFSTGPSLFDHPPQPPPLTSQLSNRATERLAQLLPSVRRLSPVEDHSGMHSG